MEQCNGYLLRNLNETYILPKIEPKEIIHPYGKQSIGLKEKKKPIKLDSTKTLRRVKKLLVTTI